MVVRGVACIATLLVLAACQPSPAAARPPASPSPSRPASAWRALAAPMPQSYRGVAYDPVRGEFWVLSRADPTPSARVELQRFDPRLDAWYATSVALSAEGYIKALLQVAPDGTIWLGWGRTLARYDPARDTVQAWPLPPGSAGVWSTDGDMVSMLLATDGEVWIATEPVHAIFGFNPGSARWDRKVALPFEANDWSLLSEVAPGKLLINGVFVRGVAATSELANVDIARSTATLLPPHAGDYLLTGDELIYVDDSPAVRMFNLRTGTGSLVSLHLPAARPDALALDPKGRLWFSVESYRYLGVGRVDLGSGLVTTYPFPYIDRPGQHNTQPNTCPPNAFHCIPPDAIPGTTVQAIDVDQSGTVWVFTDTGGATTDYSSAPAPLYAFRPPDAA